MPVGLEKVFGFDKTDLSRNQNNELSARQLERLTDYRRIRKKGGKLAFGAMILTSVFWFAMWLWGIGLNFDSKKHFEMTVAFFAAISVIWLLFLFFYRLGEVRSDLKSGKISSVEGFASHKQKKLPRGLGTAYFVTVGGVKFQVETEAQFKEIKPATKYRFYYVRHPPVQIILSVAELTDFPL